MDPKPEPVAITYLCADCGLEMALKLGDPIVCKRCDKRIFYKKRTRSIVQHEAR